MVMVQYDTPLPAAEQHKKTMKYMIDETHFTAGL